MNKNIKIVPMTPADIDTVYGMELIIFKDDPWPIEWFREGVSDNQGYYFLAYWGDELAGYGGMYHNTSQTPHYCKITNLGVLQNYRKKGIGKALLLKILETAKERKLDRAKLEVSTKNSAIKLYESLGFKKDEVIEKYYDKSGDDAYIMWRYEDFSNT